MAQPFIHYNLRDNEMWLLVKDAKGLMLPLGTTGPIPLPSDWRAAIQQNTKGNL